MPQDLEHLVPTLQVAIGPVILISGIGLLLLSMTNRYGRAIDRSRLLVQARRASADDARSIDAQIEILWRRARLLRRAIFFASLSVFFAALLIIALFVAALFAAELAWLVTTVFVLCMLCLIASQIDSIRDVNQSLVALKLEIGRDAR